jgi:hypothetical protein
VGGPGCARGYIDIWVGGIVPEQATHCIDVAQAQPQEYYVQQDGITYLVGGPPGGYAPPEHYGGQYVTAPGVDPASMAAMHEGNFQTWTGPDGAVYVTAPQYYPQPMHHPQSLH